MKQPRDEAAGGCCGAIAAQGTISLPSPPCDAGHLCVSRARIDSSPSIHPEAVASPKRRRAIEERLLPRCGQIKCKSNVYLTCVFPSSEGNNVVAVSIVDCSVQRITR